MDILSIVIGFIVGVGGTSGLFLWFVNSGVEQQLMGMGDVDDVGVWDDGPLLGVIDDTREPWINIEEALEEYERELEEDYSEDDEEYRVFGHV